jgi:hypothetical protein
MSVDADDYKNLMVQVKALQDAQKSHAPMVKHLEDKISALTVQLDDAKNTSTTREVNTTSKKWNFEKLKGISNQLFFEHEVCGEARIQGYNMNYFTRDVNINLLKVRIDNAMQKEHEDFEEWLHSESPVSDSVRWKFYKQLTNHVSIELQQHIIASGIRFGDVVGVWDVIINQYKKTDVQSETDAITSFYSQEFTKTAKFRDFSTFLELKRTEINGYQIKGISISSETKLRVIMAKCRTNSGLYENAIQFIEEQLRRDPTTPVEECIARLQQVATRKESQK